MGVRRSAPSIDTCSLQLGPGGGGGAGGELGWRWRSAGGCGAERPTSNSDNCTESRWSQRNLSGANQRLRPGGTNSDQVRNDVTLLLTN